jgi:hypothetical protein
MIIQKKKPKTKKQFKKKFPLDKFIIARFIEVK